MDSEFELKVAPFGLVLLPSYYSKAMQDTLSGLKDFARNYMDDILIASYTEKEHLDHITQVFEQFSQIQNETETHKMHICPKQNTIPSSHPQS